MSVQAKRLEISNRFRKEEKESIFQKIRMTLISQQSSGERKEVKQVTASGQFEIIQSIQAYRNDKVPIMFESVNEYIIAFKEPFTEEFKYKLTEVVLDSFRTNGHAIACLAHLLFSCSEASFLKQIDHFKDNLRRLIEDNLIVDGSRIQNGSAIAFLLYNVLKLHENKEDVYYLSKYYPIFARSNGYFDLSFLIMVEAASHCRFLLPEESFLQSFLAQDLPYHELGHFNMMFVCEILENYVCYNLSKELFGQLSNWVGKRLKERKFSLGLKKDLLKIITIALCYEQVAVYIDSKEANLKIFQEVANIARFGSSACKEQALACLACLATKCSKYRLEYFVEQVQLLEIIVFALEFDQEIDLTFKLFQSLFYIFNGNKKYLQMAKTFGLKSYLNRLSESSNIRLNEIVTVLLSMYEENK